MPILYLSILSFCKNDSNYLSANTLNCIIIVPHGFQKLPVSTQAKNMFLIRSGARVKGEGRQADGAASPRLTQRGLAASPEALRRAGSASPGWLCMVSSSLEA